MAWYTWLCISYGVVGLITIRPTFRCICLRNNSIFDWSDFWGLFIGAAALAVVWIIWVPFVGIHKCFITSLGSDPTKAAAILTGLEQKGRILVKRVNYKQLN